MRPATHARSPLAEVTSATVIADRTRLGLADGRTVEVPLVANRRSAATFRASVRRLAAVEIDAERRTAVAIGTAFRRPFVRSIPVSMALGLLVLGVPGVAR